jgi:hypothetical protein
MSRKARRRWRWIPWQTSLRTLLVVTLAAGTLGGLVGPDLVRVIRERQTAPAPTPPTLTPIPLQVHDYEDLSNGYFESAESPLR